MHNKRVNRKDNKLSKLDLQKINGGAVTESLGDAQPEGTPVFDICLYEHSKNGLPIRGEPKNGPNDITRNGHVIPMSGGCDGLPTIDETDKLPEMNGQ